MGLKGHRPIHCLSYNSLNDMLVCVCVSFSQTGSWTSNSLTENNCQKAIPNQTSSLTAISLILERIKKTKWKWDEIDTILLRIQSTYESAQVECVSSQCHPTGAPATSELILHLETTILRNPVKHIPSKCSLLFTLNLTYFSLSYHSALLYILLYALYFIFK